MKALRMQDRSPARCLEKLDFENALFRSSLSPNHVEQRVVLASTFVFGRQTKKRALLRRSCQQPLSNQRCSNLTNGRIIENETYRRKRARKNTVVLFDE